MDQVPLPHKNQKDNKKNKLIIISVISIIILSILIFIDLSSTNYLKEFYYKISGREIVEKAIFPGVIEERKDDKITSRYYFEGGFGLVDEKYCLKIISEGCEFMFIRKNIFDGTTQQILNILGRNASAVISTLPPDILPTICVYSCSK